MRLSPKDRFFLVIKYICLVFFTVLCLYPLLWLLLSSFKTNTELYANPWGLPESFSFVNYIQAIEEGHILQYFGNSVIIAVSAVFVSVLLSSMAVSYTHLQRRLYPEITASSVIAWRRNIPYSQAVNKMIKEINAFWA